MDRDADERARQSGEARADDKRLASLRQQLYLFGTLMSFGIALLGGVAVSEFIRAAEVCAEPPEQPIRRVEDNPKNTNASSHSNPLAARLSAPAEAGRDAAVPDPCPPGVLRTASHPLPVLMTVDTGVDDALAILLALHARQEIKLLGIATVDGNTSADQAALNTLYLLERFGCAAEVSVVAGADKPLRRAIPKPVPEIHGVDGLGGVTTDYWRGAPSGRRPRCTGMMPSSSSSTPPASTARSSPSSQRPRSRISPWLSARIRPSCAG